MRIRGLAAKFPERRVANADLIDWIVETSKESFLGDFAQLKNELDSHFRFIGAGFRHLREPGESALSYAVDSCREAMEQSQTAPADVDLVIYCGVGRGFLEPAMAYVVADALELRNTQCFDIVDACMSWTRSLFLAKQFLEQGKFKTILVVTCEMSMNEPYATALRLTTLNDLKFRFAGLTIGEAATATVLSADPGNIWNFHFVSVPKGQNLCYVPLPAGEGYSHRAKFQRNEPLTFYCFHEEMARLGTAEFTKVSKALFDRRRADFARVNHIFCHSDQAAGYQLWARQWGVEERLRLIFPEFGNCAASSIPLALDVARKKGNLKRGDLVLSIIVSAGLSAAFVDFTF
jgi:acyl-CoA:acyl-CoA alkyltransferase